MAGIDTGTTELSNPQNHHKAEWKTDPRCSLESLLITVVKWLDDGTIPDSSKTESSADLLKVIDKAEKMGGTCDQVRVRMLAALL